MICSVIACFNMFFYVKQFEMLANFINSANSKISYFRKEPIFYISFVSLTIAIKFSTNFFKMYFGTQMFAFQCDYYQIITDKGN